MGANDPTTSYYWDDGALVTKVAFPEGNGIRYVYDQGRFTTMARCTAGGLSGTISRADSNYLVTSYGYDSAATWTLVSSVTDPAGNTWTLGRDAYGNVTTYTTPEHPNDEWALSYDSYGRLEQVDDPRTGGRSTTTAAGAS